MASVDKTVLVPFSAPRFFVLVERLRDSRVFLAWYSCVTTLERNADAAIVPIDIDVAGCLINAFVRRADVVCAT